MYPIDTVLADIVNHLQETNTLIIQAPPGAGKSTVLPVHLLKENICKGKKIIMLEPRRLAARAVAARMSELLGEEVGETVGYRIRFDNVISKKTKLEVVTEGILNRMLHSDPALEDYGLVIFDEFHERSINADLGLALTRQAQGMLRNDLKILVMSATIDTAVLSSILNAPVVNSEGRKFPVELIYKPEDKTKSLAENITALVKDALERYDGDFLVFLPGAGEIRSVQEKLESANALIYPLYGELSLSEQHKAILPDSSGRRKVVLATSIAETSLTIEGIKVVIDSGYARYNRYDPSSGLNRLVTVRLTKDTADQRAGRSGRTGPGTCIRMWSELEQQHLSASRKPELEEADLSSLMLDLARWGDTDPNNYEWITPPPASSMKTAKGLLEKLEAIKDNKITEKGRRMSELPAHPRIAHMLIEAHSSEIDTAVDIAALLEERDPLPRSETVNIATRADALRRVRRKEKAEVNMNLLQKINRSCISWAKIMNCRLADSFVDDQLCGKLLSYVYPERLGKKAGGNRYRLANGRSVLLPEHDELLKEEWISVGTMDASRDPGRAYYAAMINMEDLLHLAEKVRTVKWDDEKDMIISSEDLKIGPLAIESKAIQDITSEERITVVAEQLKKKGLKFLTITDNFLQLIARIMSLSKWNPGAGWPEISEKVLTEDISWLIPYISRIRKRSELAGLDHTEILKSSLPWELQQQLDALAPVAIEVPSGSKIKLQYFEDARPPILAVRLQELFGLLETPTINNGKQKVMIHLLSPGYKPVQVTQDLRSFWSNTYKEVRKELKIRYAKHYWPEDPFSAEAVRGVRRK